MQRELSTRYISILGHYLYGKTFKCLAKCVKCVSVCFHLNNLPGVNIASVLAVFGSGFADFVGLAAAELSESQSEPNKRNVNMMSPSFDLIMEKIKKNNHTYFEQYLKL